MSILAGGKVLGQTAVRGGWARLRALGPLREVCLRLGVDEHVATAGRSHV
jgi:hypothetical protein